MSTEGPSNSPPDPLELLRDEIEDRRDRQALEEAAGRDPYAPDEGDPRILQHPDISRQWVLRRLQKALTIDLALASFQEGVARAAGRAEGAPIAEMARDTAARSAVLDSLIRELGSEPYSSVGLARGASRLGGRLLGVLRTPTRSALLRLTEEIMSEYDVLVAFVDGAPGVEPGLERRLRPLADSARRQYETVKLLQAR